jgi:hypothetical protein
MYIGHDALYSLFDEVMTFQTTDNAKIALAYGVIATGAQLEWLNKTRASSREDTKMLAERYYDAALAHIELTYCEGYSIIAFQVSCVIYNRIRAKGFFPFGN